ncbi:MAG: aliphatic sulfonate ABC transporter substrate-binding protein [Negativicutes bacterium]|nr:aliphatic sulfonate ABC transporter substrate-binding protein [Negativicutes bacterium]
MVGCGSNQPAPQQPAQKIIIAYTPWTGYGALFVAKEKGMFKSRGLDVELQSIEGVGDRKQALAAGKIQGMAASLDVSVSAVAELPLKFVWAFDSSAGADGLIVKPEIKTMADLKGKQVAYHKGSASHLLLAALLDKAGMKESDIVSVDMKASEAAAAFMAGKVDAAITWEPHLSKAAKAGGTILATSKDTPGLIADVLVFKDDYVKANSATVEKIVAAMAEATEYLQKNPADASKPIAEAFKMKPEEVVEDFATLKFYDLKGNLDFYGTTEKPGPMYDVAKRAAQFYVDQKVLKEIPDVTKNIDPSFINKLKK